MKKFEEELKNGPVMIDKDNVTGTSIYDEGTLIGYFNGWVSPEDYQAEIAKLNSKIDWLHGLLDERNEEVLQTVKLLNEAQPEIPECVAEFIENYADINETSLLYIMKDFVESKHWDVFCEIPNDLKKYGRWDDMLYKAIRFGYTVAKEKRFYLKSDRELEDVGDICIGYITLYLNNDGYFTTNKKRARKFTQSEIDSMDIGSCEKVEVKV